MAKIEPTFLCFGVPYFHATIECAMFVRATGVPLAFAINEPTVNDGFIAEGVKSLDRAARFLNRLLEDDVPWQALVSCSESVRRANTPIMALVIAAARAIERALEPPFDPVLHADRSITAGGRDFDREC